MLQSFKALLVGDSSSTELDDPLHWYTLGIHSIGNSGHSSDASNMLLDDYVSVTDTNPRSATSFLQLFSTRVPDVCNMDT